MAALGFVTKRIRQTYSDTQLPQHYLIDIAAQVTYEHAILKLLGALPAHLTHLPFHHSLPKHAHF